MKLPEPCILQDENIWMLVLEAMGLLILVMVDQEEILLEDLEAQGW